MDKTLSLDQITRAALHQSELLSHLSNEDFEKLIAGSQEIVCNFGDIISGQEVEKHYILTSGKVRLIDKNKKGEETTICLLEHPGDFWISSKQGEDNGHTIVARASEQSLLLRVHDLAMEEL